MKRHGLFALGSLSLLIGCGGSSMRAAEPASAATGTTAPAEPEPTTIEEAQARVKRAQAALEPPAPSPTTASGATSDFSASSKAEDSCRAFHSLERATAALCRLAGETDDRCKDAKQALETSRTRVKCE